MGIKVHLCPDLLCIPGHRVYFPWLIAWGVFGVSTTLEWNNNRMPNPSGMAKERWETFWIAHEAPTSPLCPSFIPRGSFTWYYSLTSAESRSSLEHGDSQIDTVPEARAKKKWNPNERSPFFYINYKDPCGVLMANILYYGLNQSFPNGVLWASAIRVHAVNQTYNLNFLSIQIAMQ